ncbi:PREDICTED: pentatricopeptide repeat-containing protein MRL1, chloroplastic isoform X2 [Nelumbo nucifera]|uniref:Pentatricopeptide repeat-containing protein MRL1, chloroplastic isoform X2 n=2 Tax=Nelumbo nucifera TaxID=4432 RepID=A0A1U7ZM60_NELNU|nr:PREDICTED: pentatricopeptide repeat-containing protein MRL1, chloroplastic isoform X2 [Nelumbo nucifera]
MYLSLPSTHTVSLFQSPFHVSFSSLSRSLSLRLASMDVNLSAKAQNLTLISCFTISSSYSSSSSSSTSSPRFCSLRREFLGSCDRLRFPGARSRRKCKKLGFLIQSPRLLPRASLYSKPFLVIVAIATFSALTVVYSVHTRRKKDAQESSGTQDPDEFQNLALSKQSRDFTNQSVDNQILDLEKISDGTPAEELKAIFEETSEKGHNNLEKEVQLSQFKKTALMFEESPFTEASELSYSVCSTKSSILTKETESMDPTLSSPVLGESASGEKVRFAKDMPELVLKGYQEEAVPWSELSGLLVDPKSSSVIHLKHVPAEVSQEHQFKNELDDEGEVQVSTYNGFFRPSFREEIHTFYEENQSGVRTNMLSGAEVSEGLHNTTDYHERKMPLSCYKEGSCHRRKDFRIGKGFPRDTGKKLTPQNGDRNLHHPQPNGLHVSDRNDISGSIDAYNRLLSDGRVTDCVELLEDLERKGLLDMNKVYHAKFFNTCKSQKAVNEAFRFIKLISNPTMSTFNMLLSVCASCQDSDGAFQVLQFVKEAGLKADCKLYTTLISTCAKSGKVDAMFEVFHEMVNAGVEPNVHTYGALIDGCARAGQVAKAFGAYGIMRSKKVKPDRVVFNALITACGQSGAVDRAFDVLAEMRTENQPIDPDHVTVGALIKTCTQAGQVDRAREVYMMIHEYNIKGTPDVYTIAVNSCSQTGDLDFALNIYSDMRRNGVVPDEMFLSALIDVAGHAGKLDVAFQIIEDAKKQGMQLGNVSYSSLMGACSNAKNWQKAQELYENIMAIKLHPTVSMMNALITSLCEGNQLQKAVKVLDEMKEIGICPENITYSILLVACEKKDELELGFTLLSEAKKEGIVPNLIMCRCLTGMCLRRFEKSSSMGEPVLSFSSGKPQVNNKWTSLALMVYRETIVAGVVPTMEVFSQVLGCLQLPRDTSLRERLVENLGVNTSSSKHSSIYSLIDGFGEYDSRSFSLLEEAASLGVVPCVSFKESPIVVDTRKLDVHTAEVYFLTILRGLKHRLAAGAKLPNVTILLPLEKTKFMSNKGNRTINLAGRIGQAIASLLRRLRLTYQGNESYGKIRINGLALKRWFQPKLDSPFSGKPAELSSSPTRLGKGISDQQRSIRSSKLSLE